jgi:hypothetical protein
MKIGLGIIGGLVAANVGMKLIITAGGSKASLGFLALAALAKPLDAAIVPFWHTKVPSIPR